MAKLAINGAEPLRKAAFPSWPVHDQAEVEAVTEVVESGKWFRFAYATGLELDEPSSGPMSRAVEFAHTFAAYHGAKYGVCTANGTGSLEMLFKAIGIWPVVDCGIYTYDDCGNLVDAQPNDAARRRSDRNGEERVQV